MKNLKKNKTEEASLSTPKLDWIEVNRVQENAIWQSEKFITEPFLHQLCSLTLDFVMKERKVKKHPPFGEISILLSIDETVQVLNRDYRDKDKPTNILSFETDGPRLFDKDYHLPIIFGDIVLAYETIKKESIEQNKSFKDHFIHLIIHGLLHLLGYDHINKKDAEKMEATEIAILSKLNIPNPYLDHA